MRRLAVLLFAFFIVPNAWSQTVQKCVARDGHARYQSEPCAPGQRTAGVWDATPDAVSPPPAQSPRPRGRTRAAHARRRSYRSDARRFATAPDACEQARTYRDEAERRAGLSRNYELLSTLQRRVFDACR